MTESFDDDVPEWSKHQARLLRQHAAGRPANEIPDGPSSTEDTESVGRGRLTAEPSLLVQALLHGLKRQAWPNARDLPHWQAEARGLRRGAARAFAPSKRQHINLGERYIDAPERLPEMLDGNPPQPVPATCPPTLHGPLARPT